MKMSAVIRAIIAIIAFALLIWVNINYFTAGTVIGTAVFGGAFAVCVFWKPFSGFVKRLSSKLVGRIVLIIFGTVIGFCTVSCVIFSVNMAISMDHRLDSPEAVVVLGCQVRGEEPSVMLAKRLDAAIEVLSEYPDAVCVVSGGQGNGEGISEAEAMRRYLVKHGISEERVISEDRSTSTRENIAFSSELLKERGISRAVIVTSDFHQYRAGIYAKRHGLTVGHHSGRTPILNLANYWVREWAALFDALVRG